MTAFAEIIDTSMADTRAAKNRVFSVEHDFLIGDVEPANSVFAGLDISHIAVVPDRLTRASMSHTLRVKVWTSRRASIAQVAYPNIFELEN